MKTGIYSGQTGCWKENVSVREKGEKMAKWKDVTDYFSEEQRHYNGKYLEQDDVYDETVEVSIFSDENGPCEIYFSYEEFYGIIYGEPENLYEIRDKVKAELQQEYDKHKQPTDEFIDLFCKKYDVCMQADILFNFDLF